MFQLSGVCTRVLETESDFLSLQSIPLGLQIAQSRPYLHTLGPQVGIIYIHGALEYRIRNHKNEETEAPYPIMSAVPPTGDHEPRVADFWPHTASLLYGG